MKKNIRSNINVEIGARLTNLRKSKGVSKSELAKALSKELEDGTKLVFSYNTIYRYELGESPFDVVFLTMLADFFNVDINYFLYNNQKVILKSENCDDIILKLEKKNRTKILKYFSELAKISDKKIFSTILTLTEDIINMNIK